MARSFGSANSDVIRTATTSVAGNTGTIAGWLKPGWNSGDSAQHYWFNSEGANDSPSFQKFTDNNIYAGFNTGGNTRVVVADAGLFTSGTWAHWAITWSVAAGQTLYKNAVSKGTSGYASFSNAQTNFFIGNNQLAGSNSFFGSLADFAMWNVILSGGELTALANGARPWTIRATKQIYLPLDGLASPEPDFSGNALNGTVTGAAQAAGPPIMMFTPRWLQNISIGAAAGSTVFRRALSALGTRTGTRQIVEAN